MAENGRQRTGWGILGGFLFPPLLLPHSSGSPLPLVGTLTQLSSHFRCVLLSILPERSSQKAGLCKAPIRSWFPMLQTLRWHPNNQQLLLDLIYAYSSHLLCFGQCSLFWISPGLSSLRPLYLQFPLLGSLFSQPAPSWIQTLNSTGFPYSAVILHHVIVSFSL